MYVNSFRLATQIIALETEVKTNNQMRLTSKTPRSVLSMVKKEYGCTGNKASVLFQLKLLKAAVDKAFSSAAHVTKLEFINNRLIPNAIEPRAANGMYSRADVSSDAVRRIASSDFFRASGSRSLMSCWLRWVCCCTASNATVRRWRSYRSSRRSGAPAQISSSLSARLKAS